MCTDLCSCSEEATRQLVSEAAMDSLVALTSHTDSSDIVSAASFMLLSVASNAPSLRPYLGRAGAVKYFIHCLEELVTSEGTLPHKFHMIDALCQCCRDANNRIKIREHGGLSVLIGLLLNSQLANIHHRIISALVCFIYDDASITVLLQSRLVPTLISHLYCVAEIENKLDYLGLDSSIDVCESLKIDVTEIRVSDLEHFDNVCVCFDDLKSADNQLTSFSVDTELKQNDLLNCAASCQGFSVGTDSPDAAAKEPLSAVDSTLLESDKLDVPVVNCEGTQEFEVLSAIDEPAVYETSEGEVCAKTPRYSIYSPTYKAVSAWRMETDEDEDRSRDRHSPRNIWEGARLYAENLSATSPSISRSGSVSPSSCSEGLCSVQSWTSSLCDSSPRKSPAVSPAWSLDSAGSGIYSPFSNSSYVYPNGACSPSAFSDADDCQPVSFSRCDSSKDKLQAAPETHIPDNEHVECSSLFQTNILSEKESAIEEAHSKSTVNNAFPDSLGFDTDVLDNGQQQMTLGSSGEFSSNVDEVDSKKPIIQSKSEAAIEEEFKEQCSDEEFDVESFQRKRQDERKFSKLMDIAKSMYASIETEPVIHPQQTKKRRRNSSGNTSPSSFTRQKAQCSVISSQTENILCTTDTSGPNNSAVALQDKNSGSKSDSDSCAEIAQNMNVVDGMNSGDVNSDTESKASSDGITATACSDHQQNVSRVTERNILTLIAHISHFPETIAYVMNAGTICGLLDYTLLARSPLPAAGRTLLRLSRSDHGFQRAILCLFPAHAAWRLEPEWLASGASSSPPSDSSVDSHCCMITNSVDCMVSGEDTQSCKHERSDSSESKEVIFKNKMSSDCGTALNAKDKSCIVESSEAERMQECATSKLCDEILANLSTIAVSGYGQGVLYHLLLQGSQRQRDRCIISLFFLCRFVFCGICISVS